jgi:hypothetical protein
MKFDFCLVKKFGKLIFDFFSFSLAFKSNEKKDTNNTLTDFFLILAGFALSPIPKCPS